VAPLPLNAPPQSAAAGSRIAAHSTDPVAGTHNTLDLRSVDGPPP